MISVACFYVALVPEKIESLMHIEKVVPSETIECTILLIDDPRGIKNQGLVNEDLRVGVSKPEPQDAETPTKTKTTTKNKTIDYPTHTDMLCEIVDTAVDVLTSSRETMKLDGEERSVEHIKHRYKELNFCHMQYVVNSLLSHEKGIKNIPAFIRTTLYNAPATMGIHYDALIQHDKAVREGRIAM